MNKIKRSTQNVSPYLKGNKRLENEPFDEYKLRLKWEKRMIKLYLRGEFHGANVNV